MSITINFYNMWKETIEGSFYFHLFGISGGKMKFDDFNGYIIEINLLNFGIEINLDIDHG